MCQRIKENEGVKGGTQLTRSPKQVMMTIDDDDIDVDQSRKVPSSNIIYMPAIGEFGEKLSVGLSEKLTRGVLGCQPN